MKLTLSIAAFLIGASGYAQEIVIERSRNVVPLTVPLNKDTVRCLIGDYSASSLKISVPQLKGSTVFPQTTRGETAPCINAGFCQIGQVQELDPSMILDPARPTENIKVTVVLNEVLNLDPANKKCDRSLREDLSSTVRGLEFKHSDGAYLGALDYDTCLQLMK